MLRFAPITNAKQIQRSFEDERYPLSVPIDTPEFIVVLCKDRYQGLGDAHQVCDCV